MNLRIEILLVIALLFICCKQSGPMSDKANSDDQNTLVEVFYLMDRQDNEDVKIIDFRRSEEYNEGHIPGAINIWRSDLEDKTYPYGGMKPAKEQIEELFSSRGIENDDILVVYDDKGSVDAARLWWILSYYGFDRLKILNGGLSAWIEAGGDIDKSIPVISDSRFVLGENQRPEICTDGEYIQRLLIDEDRQFKIIDTRSFEEFSGHVQKKGAKRGGRIPGSIHIEWIETIDTLTNNRFRKAEELHHLYRNKGLNSNDSVIVYCHSGSRSSHTTFVLREILKYNVVMNYDGSWTEWSYYDHLPVEKDSITLITN